MRASSPWDLHRADWDCPQYKTPRTPLSWVPVFKPLGSYWTDAHDRRLALRRVAECHGHGEAARRNDREDVARSRRIALRRCRRDAHDVVVVLQVVDAEADLGSAQPRIPAHRVV